MSWQHLGRLGGNNIPSSRNHGDVMRPPTQAELAAYVGWVGSINPAPSQSPVASPAEGTWRSWVDGANPAYGHRTQSPACNQRPAASAVSSGCVLNAMAAPGAALWTALRTRSNRSEEHTSELPSLMRISYAVFCLKKKKR